MLKHSPCRNRLHFLCVNVNFEHFFAAKENAVFTEAPVMNDCQQFFFNHCPVSPGKRMAFQSHQG